MNASDAVLRAWRDRYRGQVDKELALSLINVLLLFDMAETAATVLLGGPDAEVPERAE